MCSLFNRILLPAAALSGAIFAATTLPLVAVPEDPLAVEFQGKTVFHGSLEELATPYLGLAAGVSLGVGLAGATLLGWRVSARTLSQTEATVEKLRQELQEKEARIEKLTFSESRLQSAALDRFLADDPEEAIASPISNAPAFTVIAAPPSIQATSTAQAEQPSEALIGTASTLSSVSTTSLRQRIKTALPAAQVYGGYLRPTEEPVPSAVTDDGADDVAIAPAAVVSASLVSDAASTEMTPVQAAAVTLPVAAVHDTQHAAELLHQLKSLMTHLEHLQQNNGADTLSPAA